MKSVTIIIVAGLVARFALACLYHPDIKTQSFHGQFTSSGVADIYSFIENNRSTLPYTDTFNYPPLAYFWLGTNAFVANLTTGTNFTSWLNDWTNPAGQSEHVLGFLLRLKLPYLILDLLLLTTLLILTRKNRLAVFVWAFNPLNLYSTYAIGQFDIVPAVCLFVGVLLYKRHPIISGTTLAVGAGIKSFPLLGGVVLFYPGVALKTKLKFVFGLGGVLLLVYLPVITNPNFLFSQLNAGLLSRAWEIRWAFIPLLPVFLTLLILIGFLLKKSVHRQFGSIMTLIVSFVRPHAQWGVWSYPFICRLVANSSLKMLLLYFVWTMILFANIILLPDLFVLVGLFSSLTPQILNSPVLVDKIGDPAIIRQSAQTILAICGLALSVIIFFGAKKSGTIRLPLTAISLVLSIFIAFSIPLFPILYTAKLVNYLPVSQVAVDPGAFAPLVDSRPLVTKLSVPVDGLNQISVYMKNTALKNTSPLRFELLNADMNPIRSMNINGSNVGDGVHVPFRFPLISDSQGKNYYLSLTTQGSDPHSLVVSLPGNQIASSLYADPDLNPNFTSLMVKSVIEKMNSKVFLLAASIWIFICTLFVYLSKKFQVLFAWPKLNTKA